MVRRWLSIAFTQMLMRCRGGVAAHIARNGQPVVRSGGAGAGRAFCFLPLPVETGLPLHVNGLLPVLSVLVLPAQAFVLTQAASS